MKKYKHVYIGYFLLLVLGISSCSNNNKVDEGKVILPPPTTSEAPQATPPMSEAENPNDPAGDAGLALQSNSAEGTINGFEMIGDIPLNYVEVKKDYGVWAVINPCNKPVNILNFEPNETFLYLIMEGDHKAGYLVSDTQSTEKGMRFFFETTNGKKTFKLELEDASKLIYSWKNETKGEQYLEYYITTKTISRVKQMAQACKECFTNCEEMKKGASPIPIKKDD